MLVYILKSIASLAILFVFYKIFLEKENMHVFKRFYLLGALVFSMIIPSLVFTEYVMVEPEPIVTVSTPVIMQQAEYSNDVINVPQALETDVVDIEPILWGVYFIGLFFFGLKFIRNLFQIFRRIRKNPKQKFLRFTQVLLQEKITPHTFFSYIFLNKNKFETDQIPAEVLLHEQTHASQKHSWDVILVELLHVIFWINPFIYLTKKAIKLNHEFLADQAVLKENIDKITYQNTLLSYLSPDSEKKYQPLANAINYSSIKKRFTVMKTHTSKKAVLLRSLLLLPLLAVLVYGFSDTKIETISIEPERFYDSEIQESSPISEELKKINALELNYHQLEGNWIEKDSELSELSITSINGEYIFNWLGSDIQKVLENNSEFYFVTPQGKIKLPLTHDIKNRILTYANVKYIPLENSVKGKLYGQWENKKEDIKFNVTHNGNEIVWDIIRADEKPVRYYPKKQADGYVFTYGKDSYLWSFKVKNDILYDSKGLTYKVINVDDKITNRVSREEISKYNALAKKYNTIPIEKRTVPMNDLKIMETVFRKLSKNQKNENQPFPEAISEQNQKELFTISEDIIIYINTQGKLLVQDDAVALKDLKKYLTKINSHLSKQQRVNQVRSKINIDVNAPEKVINKVLNILEEFGTATIDIAEWKDGKYVIKEDSATKKQIAEYNSIAKKYNTMLSKSKSIQIKIKDVERLEYIYDLMSKKQKATAEPFPDFPPMPETPVAPDAPKAPNEREEAENIIDKIIEEQDPYDNVHAVFYSPNNKKGAASILKGEVSNIPTPPEPNKIIFINNPKADLQELKEDTQLNEGVGKIIINGKEHYYQSKDNETKYYNKHGNRVSKKGILITPAENIEVIEVIEVPKPPVPKSPLDHVIEMAKKDAKFYFEGKEISSDKAIELMKNNKDINIDSKANNGKRPVVKMSTEPINH